MSPLKLTELRQIAFDGTKDGTHPMVGSPRHRKLIQNMMPVDPQFGTGLPAALAVSRSVQLGASGHWIAQHLVQFTKRSGTEYTCAFVGESFLYLRLGVNQTLDQRGARRWGDALPRRAPVHDRVR